MAKIRIRKNLTAIQFRGLSEKWCANENVSIVIPEELSDDQADALFRLLLSQLPNEFAFCVLENLAARQSLSMELLAELFDFGDTACCVTICLRDDLSDAIATRCLQSDDPAVREHFQQREGSALAK